MVLAVDVQPDPRVAQVVGDLHAQHLGVEACARLQVGGQAVDVAELAGTHRRQLARRAGDRRAGVVVWREREDVVLEALVVAETQMSAVILEGRVCDTEVLACLIERH